MKGIDINKEVLDHYLVPKHIILTEKEKKELLEKLNISEDQLPKISINDPIIKLIGAKEKDVIKIIRKSFTSGEAIYYRIVVKEIT